MSLAAAIQTPALTALVLRLGAMGKLVSAYLVPVSYTHLDVSKRQVQERSKKGITGRLKEIACKKVDEKTEALVEMIGENQIDYRFFLGFKLLVNEEEISLKGMKKSAAMSFTDFIYEVNHKLMGDFVSMSNDEDVYKRQLVL